MRTLVVHDSSYDHARIVAGATGDPTRARAEESI